MDKRESTLTPDNSADKKPGVLAKAAAIGAASLMLAACAPGESTSAEPPTKEPGNEVVVDETTPPEPTETEKPSLEYTLPSAENISIEAGLSIDDFSVELHDALTDWGMEGTQDPAMVETYYNTSDGDLQAIYESRADQNSDEYIEALMAPGWESNPANVNFVEYYENLNVFNIDMAMLTQSGSGGEPWENRHESTTVSSVTPIEEYTGEEGDTRRIAVVTTQYNNASKNIVGTKIHPEMKDQNGGTDNIQFDTVVINGKELIQNVIPAVG